MMHSKRIESALTEARKDLRTSFQADRTERAGAIVLRMQRLQRASHRRIAVQRLLAEVLK